MSRKAVLRSIIFLIIVALVFNYILCVFHMKAAKNMEGAEEKFNDFYRADRNSIEAVILGTSAVDRAWIGPVAYKNFGLCVSDMSTARQPMVLTKYIIKEVEKYQDPQLYIIDLRSVVLNEDEIRGADIRRVTDNMKFSLNRWKAVTAGLEFAATGENEVDLGNSDSYYFSFLKYHSMVGQLDKTDFWDLKPNHIYKGYYGYADVIFNINEGVVKPVLTDEREEVSESMEGVIRDLLEYCDTIDGDVLFTVIPFSATDERQRQLNYAIDMIEESGYDVLNFNNEQLYAEMDIDFTTTHYNVGHTNLLGANKVTDYLADYIQKNYEFKDWRENGGREDWEEAYEVYAERIEPYYADMCTEAERIKNLN